MKSIATLHPARPERIRQDLEHIVNHIGVRLAGSPTDREVIEYIADRFAPVADVTEIEEFPTYMRAVTRERLRIRTGKTWHEYPCSLFSSAPGTRGQAVRADLAVFSPKVDFQRPDLSYLTGKAVICFGSHIESPQDYQRLLAAQPAFLLMTDVRYPADRVTADGLFPSYVRHYGAIPTASVAYLQVCDWLTAGAAEAELLVEGGIRRGSSANVVATLAGADAAAGTIYVGAHHDTQADSVGADDNTSGVVMLLELARLLAPLPRKRTIRFVSFGAEEQLSVGSAAYVRRHRDELARHGKFMFNIDGGATLVGWNTVLFQCPKAAEKLFHTLASEQEFYYRRDEALNPYGDHFPFCAGGVPALWLGRSNCETGRYFHHRPDDDLSKVSVDQIAACVNLAAAFLNRTATAERLPFAGKLPEKLRAETARCFRDLYGGWRGLPPIAPELLED